MEFFVDYAAGNLNKYGEELCGDKVEFFRSKDSVIAVLSDGLGSGVKANILATLTSKIAITMLKEGLPIDEVVDTLIHTLPICNVRKLAYSTFTIVKIDDHGEAYVAEFDNPNMFFMRNRKMIHFHREERVVNGRRIMESRFQLLENDVLMFVSDGVIHAGAGVVLNLGWSWKEVANYLLTRAHPRMSAKELTNLLLGACDDLYMQKPGDDTTVVCMKLIQPKKAALFTGPPVNPQKDEEITKKVMSFPGKKIICGGTAANIICRETGLALETSLEILHPAIPPIAKMNGLDLVTEGVLTIKAAVELLQKISSSTHLDFLSEKHGAAKLAKILFEECTHLTLLVGRAINPAHQNPDFPEDLSIKLNMVQKLIAVLEDLGKVVEVQYY